MTTTRPAKRARSGTTADTIDRGGVSPAGEISMTPPPWLLPLQRRIVETHRGHALLLYGPDGLGHFELAFALASRWLCEGRERAPPADPGGAPTFLACGACPSCRLIAARTHPDLRVLLPEALAERSGWKRAADEDAEAGEGEGGAAGGKGRKPSREIRIDAMREAIAWSAQTPSRGRTKIMLVHPAEALNATAANALLKTLEEPPGGVRLVLTAADPDALLATVRSRCQRERLPSPTRDAALAWLTEQGIDDAEVLLDASGGRPLAARELAADGLDAVFWHRLARAVREGDASAFSGRPLPRTIDAMQKLCHDAMASAAGGAARFLPAGTLPRGAALPALAAWSRELARVARRPDHPWHAALLVDALVALGRRAWAGDPGEPVSGRGPGRSLNSGA